MSKIDKVKYSTCNEIGGLLNAVSMNKKSNICGKVVKLRSYFTFDLILTLTKNKSSLLTKVASKGNHNHNITRKRPVSDSTRYVADISVLKLRRYGAT